jgi:prepilin-type N-terminal cleavage/methylation domain-containing protein
MSKLKAQNFKIFKNRSRGFTLMEIIISMAILALFGTISVIYLGSYRRSVSIDTEAEKIVAYLRQAQNRATSGESGVDWGVHFDNPSSGDDYYALFQGDAYTSSVETIYLSNQIQFSYPAPGGTENIVFQRISGWPVATKSVTIQSVVNSNLNRIISINSAGQINY